MPADHYNLQASLQKLISQRSAKQAVNSSRLFQNQHVKGSFRKDCFPGIGHIDLPRDNAVRFFDRVDLFKIVPVYQLIAKT